MRSSEVTVLMGDGQTDVVLLCEARAMSEQNSLVSAGSAPAPNTYCCGP
jgi:hypothetical protein